MSHVPTIASSIEKKRAFTLVEMLIVVAIIALLAAILFPVFGRARAGVRRTTCASNLKQIGLALSQYAQDYRFYPPMDGGGTFTSISNPDGAIKDSYCGAWPDKVLPYTKSERVFECPSASNIRYLSGCSIADYTDDKHPVTFRGAYVFNLPRTLNAAGKMAPPRPANPLRYTRPASTILVVDGPDGETNGLAGFVNPGYANPLATNVATLQEYGVPDRHEGGVNALFADGHVKWMSLESLLKPGLWKNNGPE